MDDLEILVRKAWDGKLRPADESRLRGMLDARNPGAAALPLDKLIKSAGIELGAAILLERLAED